MNSHDERAMLWQMVLMPDSARSVSRREELAKALEARRQSDADLRRQVAELERSLANQLRGLRDGYSQSITMQIAKLENQLSAVRARLEASDPLAIKRQMRDTRRFVESRRHHPLFIHNIWVVHLGGLCSVEYSYA